MTSQLKFQLKCYTFHLLYIQNTVKVTLTFKMTIAIMNTSVLMTRGDKMNIQWLRSQKGWTQQQLADILNVSRSTIAMIENGTNKPSVKLAKKIAEVFQIDWKIFF